MSMSELCVSLLKSCFLHLLNELSTESVDDTGDRRSGTLADKVKVKHALDSTGLHAVDEASRFWVEEQVLWVWAGRSRWSSKAANVVVWLLTTVTVHLRSIGLRHRSAGRVRRTANCGHCDLRGGRGLEKREVSVRWSVLAN